MATVPAMLGTVPHARAAWAYSSHRATEHHRGVEHGIHSESEQVIPRTTVMQNLTDIAIFVKVVELSSFTAAAEALEMSQPVVSKAVTRLEEKLGARLLNRTTRRLSLTEAGSELYSRSVRALAEIENA